MGLGLATGAGGAEAYKLFVDMLVRKHQEEQDAIKQQNEGIRLGNDTAQVGIQRDALTQRGQQFDRTEARQGKEFDVTSGLDQAKFDNQKPLTIAQTKNYEANTGHTNAETRATDFGISPEHRKNVLADRLTEIRATGAEAQKTAGIRGQYAGTLSAPQQLTQTRALRNEYAKTVAPARELKRQLGMMENGLAEAQRGNLNAGSQAVLVTFQKILDPASVVRESEYARGPEGLGLLQRMQGILPKLQQGGPGVPVAELEQFARIARQLVEPTMVAAEENGKQIGDIADGFGLDRSLIEGRQQLVNHPAAADPNKAKDKRTKYDY